MVKVSIIMTVKDRAPTLKSAIESVLNSSHENLELIIWDDGSTDSSVSIASFIAQKDKRVKLTSAKHQGRARALHFSITASCGDYIGIVDSDDLLHRKAIGNTANYLDNHPSIGLVYTQCFVIDELGFVLGFDKRCTIPYSRDRLLVDMMVFHFRLFRRNLYNAKVSINLNLSAAVDYDLVLRISEVTEIAQIKQPLYYYRVSKKSISQNQPLLQVQSAEIAVRDALIRRGLSDLYQLKVIDNRIFVLVPKRSLG